MIHPVRIDTFFSHTLLIVTSLFLLVFRKYTCTCEKLTTAVCLLCVDGVIQIWFRSGKAVSDKSEFETLFEVGEVRLDLGLQGEPRAR